MRFGQPEYFHLLWLCVGLILFLVWTERNRSRLTAAFCDDRVLPKLLDRQALKKRKIRNILAVLAVTCLILALTQPRWGFKWEELRQEGVDIVVVLDVSRSMLAEDIKPNRLERAKRKVKDLIGMLAGDRIGLVVFAGTSYLQTPLTLDYAAAEMFLGIIDTDLIPVPGTVLGQAIRTAVKAFPDKRKTAKAIILITDGEDHEGHALEAAKLAGKKGIKIFAIGIGRELGAPIPQTGQKSGFEKDERGEVVLSKLDETGLQKIALETGGIYVRSVTGDMDLSKIYLENISRKIGKKEIKTARRKIWQERFQWFVLIALICLAGEFLINERKTKPQT